MASYRYERDIDPKDLKPRKQRQYSRRERWANCSSSALRVRSWRTALSGSIS